MARASLYPAAADGVQFARLTLHRFACTENYAEKSQSEVKWGSEKCQFEETVNTKIYILLHFIIIFPKLSPSINMRTLYLRD